MVECNNKETGKMQILFEDQTGQNVDCDITLPDYCTDILRILKCSVEPAIINSKISGDRVSADGSAVVRVIYTDDNDKLCCYEQDYPFSKYIDMDINPDQAQLVSSAKTEYVNCRAVSRRRVEIHGIINVKFKVCKLENNSMISSAQGDGIQLRKKSLQISNIVSNATTSFSLDEIANIEKEKSPISKIIHTHVVPILSEAKVIKGKLLLKGEIAVKLLYIPDSNSENVENADYSLPINQIVEAAGLEDDSIVNVKMEVMSSGISAKTDGDGEYRLIKINSVIGVCVEGYKNEAVEIATDAYSTKSDIDAKYNKMEFLQAQDSISDSFVARGVFDFSSMDASEIVGLWFEKPEVKSEVKASQLTVSGTIPATVIIMDDENHLAACDRNLEFEYTRGLSCDKDDYFCDTSLFVTGYSISGINDSKAEVKAEFNVHSMIFSKTSENVLCSAEIPDNAAVREAKPSLTIYFCDAGEDIWNIARKYNTTVEAIREENALTSDTAQEKTMILIPVS